MGQQSGMDRTMALQPNVVELVWKAVEFFSLFLLNSVIIQFKKFMTKAPLKWAAVSCPFLCRLCSSCVAELVQKRDPEKSLGRGSILSRALADSAVKQGATRLSPEA